MRKIQKGDHLIHKEDGAKVTVVRVQDTAAGHFLTIEYENGRRLLLSHDSVRLNFKHASSGG